MVLVTTSLQAADLLVLKSGEEIEGTVLRMEKGRVRISIEVGQGKAETSVPAEQIEKATIADGFDPAKLPADLGQRLSYLEAQLSRWRDFLPVPESAAGAMLLARADALAEAGRFQEAMLDLDAMASDWNAKRRSAAAPMKIRCLIGMKKLPEAEKMAADLQKVTYDFSSLATVKMALAEVALGKGLWDEAVDHYLFCRVYSPRLAEESSRGLFKSAQLLVEHHDLLRAAKMLDDLATDYAASSSASPAAALRQQIQPELDKIIQAQANENTNP